MGLRHRVRRQPYCAPLPPLQPPHRRTSRTRNHPPQPGQRHRTNPAFVHPQRLAAVTTQTVNNFIGLGNGSFAGSGLFAVVTYRLVESRIRELRETRQTVPNHLKHMLQALQGEAAFVLLAPEVTARGQRDARPAADLPTSPHEVIDTTEAAAQLGLSPRTLRRRAAEFGGRRIGDRWVFDPMIVAATVAGKKEASPANPKSGQWHNAPASPHRPRRGPKGFRRNRLCKPTPNAGAVAPTHCRARP